MVENSKAVASCGEALVKLLEAYGVDTVFGIPGVHTLELYRGLPSSNVRHVLTRHEQGAGFMADGYARVSGKPGVAFVITGPGLTNISTAIGQAYSDSIPMLVISSVNETNTLGKGWGRLHETKNQRAITEPLTAFSATAYRAEDIPDLIARAFAVFNSERPRPVHLEIPMDVLASPVAYDWSNELRIARSRPQAEPKLISAAADLLKASKRPVIIAGGGALDAAESLLAIAEKLTAPVFTTVAGKGIVSPQHELHGGANLCMSPAWDYLEQADLVLAIGTELADTDMWRDTLPIKGDIIRIDIDARKLNDLYPAKIGILADAMGAAHQLNQAIDSLETKPSVVADVANLKNDILQEQAELQQKHLAVLACVKNHLPAEGFIATDMTQISYTGNYGFESEGTRSWLHPTGFGTLGYGLPAGIGAKIAAPERAGLVLAGDGGFLYTLQELATAVEEIHTPFVVLLWNNDSLGQIRDDMIAMDIPTVGVSPVNPNYTMLAKAFSCQTYKPQSLDELESCLEEAFKYMGVSFIEMHDSSVDIAQ